MSYHKSLIGLSIFMVLALIVGWLVFVTLRRDVRGDTNTYSAMFTDVSGMHPGDDVRIAGVRVGRVDKVELAGTVAKVTFRVQKNQSLFTNTVASVTYQNIIGQRYLGLLPGSTESHTKLPSGATIPLERTTPSFDISNLLNGFEPLFTVLDPAQVDNLTSAIVQAFQGDQGSLLAIVTQTSALAQSLAGPDAELGTAITNLNAVITNLAAQSGNVQKLIEESRSVITTLDGRRAELVTSVGATRHAVERLATITANVMPDLQQYLEREPGFAANMLANPDRYAYVAQNMPQVLKGLARISQSGAYGDAYFCNMDMRFFATLSRVTTGIVRLASPGNVIRNSAVCR